jgi:ketosteroid isomerase-like protein
MTVRGPSRASARRPHGARWRAALLCASLATAGVALPWSGGGETGSACAADPADDAAAAVEQTLRLYEEAWSRHDAHAVASYYHEPAMRVGQGGPHVRATRADQEAFFTGFLKSLVDQGYATSRWESLQVKLLDSRSALASGVVARLSADGSVFQRQGVTYGLWKTPDGWKIYLSTTHPTEAVLPLR